MHLIACVRKGLPLPELPTKVTAKKKLQQSKKQHAPATTKPRGAEGESQFQAAAKSPKRRSRLASLVQCEEPQNDKGASISTPNTLEPPGSGQVLHSVGCMLTSATRVNTVQAAPAVRQQVAACLFCFILFRRIAIILRHALITGFRWRCRCLSRSPQTS